MQLKKIIKQLDINAIMLFMKKFLSIAIDGPVASGKGSVAVELAEQLKILYIDTGAMYRACAFLAKQNNISPKSEEEILKILHKNQIRLFKPNENEQDGRLVTVKANDLDISWEIRKEEISILTSQISMLKKIRTFLVNLQRKIAQDNHIIMEGRDITTTVLPNAQVKIFLTAKNEVRAKRRWLQLKEKGQTYSYEEILERLKKRDYQDSHREISPLKIAKDAIIIDSTELSISQIVKKIKKITHKIIKEEKINLYE
jgi:cytidylate kinase